MAGMAVPPDRETLRAAGTALAADRVAAQMADVLEKAGVSFILLRGPSIARHLYSSSEVRPYVDVDLLVPIHQAPVVESTLPRRGFAYRAVLGQRQVDRPHWSSTWVRASDGANIDVHWTLVGVNVSPETAWTEFVGETEPIDVCGTRLDGLSARATALVIALHAAHHGAGITQPIRDLDRALAKFDLEIWSGAAQLAERLDGVDAFSAGLRLAAGGEEMADRLSLPPVRSTEVLLRSSTAPPMALGFDWLSHTSGVRAKVILIAGKLVPDAPFMRSWTPLARRGRVGLWVAYAWRPIWLLRHAVPGYRAWREARRKAEG